MKSVYYQSLHIPSSINGMESSHVQIIKSSDNRYDTTLHWHDALEIVLVMEGSVNYIADGIHYTTTENQCHLINSGSIHAAKSGNPNGIASLVIEISDLYLSKILPENSLCTFNFNINSPVYIEILNILKEIVPKVETKDPYKNFFIISKLNAIIYLLYTYCLVESSVHNSCSKEIIRFVGKHYNENISLDMISNYVGLQKNYFCKKFKKETGVSFHYYLNRIRLDSALSLLASHEKTALECALQSGFSSEKIFIEWCKKIYKTTPMQYIKTGKNNPYQLTKF